MKTTSIVILVVGTILFDSVVCFREISYLDEQIENLGRFSGDLLSLEKTRQKTLINSVSNILSMIVLLIIRKYIAKGRKVLKNDYVLGVMMTLMHLMLIRIPMEVLGGYSSKILALDSSTKTKTEWVDLASDELLILFEISCLILGLKLAHYFSRIRNEEKFSSPLILGTETEIDHELCSDSDEEYPNYSIYNSYTREHRRSQSPIEVRSSLIWVYLLIFLVTLRVVLMLFPKLLLKLEATIPASSLIRDSLSHIYFNHQIVLNHPLININPRSDTAYYSSLVGFYKPQIVMSSGMTKIMSNLEISAHLSSLYHLSKVSHQIIYQIFSIMQIIIICFIVRAIIRMKNSSDFLFSSRNVSNVLLDTLLVFYSFNYFFQPFKNSVSHAIIQHADSFSLKLGYPISSAIIKQYLNNREAVLNTKLYTLFHLEQCPLSDRLINIAKIMAK